MAAVGPGAMHLAVSTEQSDVPTARAHRGHNREARRAEPNILFLRLYRFFL